LLAQTNVSTQANLARLYQIRGEVGKARKVEQALQKIYGRNPFYHFNRGQEAFEDGNFRVAVKHYKRALRRNPNQPEFHARLAVAQYKLGNERAARKSLKRAGQLARSPGQRQLYSQKLHALIAQR
jgi:Flp pilus assembly protein TadD